MVEAGSTGGGVEDSTVVHLEDRSVGLNGDSDDTLVDGGLKLADAVGWHVLVSSNLGGGTLLFGGVASSGLSGTGGVWVGALEGLGLALKELEGFVLPSTLATVAAGHAGDEFLLRE